jgi:hypothetical protein
MNMCRTHSQENQNTRKYIYMVDFKKDDEFEVAPATTLKEIEKLAAAGFEKVGELKSIHVFRRKRFRSVNGQSANARVYNFNK